MAKGPGKSYRKGISLIEIMEMFPDEATAVKWFESILWKNERPCPHCGSVDTRECKNRKPMPYRCRDCRDHFSVRTGTVLHRSHIPLRKWAIGIYLWTTSLKGVSSMKLRRDLKISQKSAWFMAHRLREVFSGNSFQFDGPVEVDETYMGGKGRNMHKAKRERLTGRGASDKVAVVGTKDRATNQVNAEVVDSTSSANLQGFVSENIHNETMVYTDDARAYKALPKHEAVKHSVGEYVQGQAHTNGIESFWAVLKRAHTGTFHKISYKHLQRYIDEFAGRHNFRRRHTLEQMATVVAAMAGRRLMFAELTRGRDAEAGFVVAN